MFRLPPLQPRQSSSTDIGAPSGNTAFGGKNSDNADDRALAPTSSAAGDGAGKSPAPAALLDLAVGEQLAPEHRTDLVQDDVERLGETQIDHVAPPQSS